MRFVCFVFVLFLPMVAVADIASVDYTKAYVQNANNITKGTLSTERLSVGSDDNTVAAGDDVRFETISVGEPDVSAPDNRAVIWIE